MKFVIRLAGMLILSLFLVACKAEKKKEQATSKERVIVAKLHVQEVPLFYSGTLNPIKIDLVLSPVQGHITEVKFAYGSFIENRQPVVVVNSTSLTQNFRKTITDYLEKKSAYAKSAESFQGTRALYRAGVISKESYLTGETSYQTSRLSYIQSQFAMEKILKLAGISVVGIEKLTLADTRQIVVYLKKQFSHIIVRSTGTGIALFPIKSAAGSEGEKVLTVGTAVKQGQAILSIGDLTGLSTKIEVSQVNINRIHKKMSATVTSSAFPGVTLHGYVAAVSEQAKTSQNSGASVFTVLVKIPNLLKKYRRTIRVGMTAKIQINIKKPPVVMVPIAAVFQKGTGAAVTVVDPNGKRRVVSIVTSFTTATEVAIAQGIKPGEKIVVPGSSESK